MNAPIDNRLADERVVFTPLENFVWDTSVVMFDAQALLEQGSPAPQDLLRVVQKAAALNQYHELMLRLK